VGNRKKRLERLEGPQERGAPIIIVGRGETNEEAWQRHLAQHPEDANETALIIRISDASRDPQGEASRLGNRASPIDQRVRTARLIK
jgi:hypothetical protein